MVTHSGGNSIGSRPPGVPTSCYGFNQNDFRLQNDDQIIIRRVTETDPLKATFFPGSSIRAQDLNDNFEQLQMAIREGQCQDESRIEVLDERYWNKTQDETVYSTMTWISDDDHVATTLAMDNHFANVFQPAAGSIVIVMMTHL